LRDSNIGLTTQLFLASRSPERKLILEDLGFQVIAKGTHVDETPLDGENAQQLVTRLCQLKASQISSEHWVIAADTVIEFNGAILGQPQDKAHASQMLKMMSGNPLRVWTGQATKAPTGQIYQSTFEAELTMKTWTQDDLANYLEAGTWAKRAGAFSVFHHPCPVTITQGRLDVVRGLHGPHIISCLKNK
jgi:septum formation protein